MFGLCFFHSVCARNDTQAIKIMVYICLYLVIFFIELVALCSFAVSILKQSNKKENNKIIFRGINFFTTPTYV